MCGWLGTKKLFLCPPSFLITSCGYLNMYVKYTNLVSHMRIVDAVSVPTACQDQSSLLGPVKGARSLSTCQSSLLVPVQFPGPIQFARASKEGIHSARANATQAWQILVNPYSLGRMLGPDQPRACQLPLQPSRASPASVQGSLDQSSLPRNDIMSEVGGASSAPLPGNFPGWARGILG